MTTNHKIEWFTLSVIAILFVILAIQNAGMTGAQFIVWEEEVPQLILIFGVGLGGILAVPVLLRHHYWNCPLSVGSQGPDSKDET